MASFMRLSAPLKLFIDWKAAGYPLLWKLIAQRKEAIMLCSHEDISPSMKKERDLLHSSCLISPAKGDISGVMMIAAESS